MLKLQSSSHHHQAGVHPQSSACSPVSYLSSAFCLSASCSASNAKISSTKGWYSRVILRKPCRKGILQHSALHTSRAGPACPHSGRPGPGFHGAARPSENKHEFRIALRFKKHHFSRSQNSRPHPSRTSRQRRQNPPGRPGGPKPAPQNEARRQRHKTPPRLPHPGAPPPEAEVASFVTLWAGPGGGRGLTRGVAYLEAGLLRARPPGGSGRTGAGRGRAQQVLVGARRACTRARTHTHVHTHASGVYTPHMHLQDVVCKRCTHPQLFSRA